MNRPPSTETRIYAASFIGAAVQAALYTRGPCMHINSDMMVEMEIYLRAHITRELACYQSRSPPTDRSTISTWTPISCLLPHR